jgi:hypothetical protein
MTAATAAGRGVRLQGVNLPAARPFVNPGSAHHGPRREPLDASGVPRPSTCPAAAPGPMPVARPAARPAMPAWWRAAPHQVRRAGASPPITARWRAAPGSSPASPARRSTARPRCRRRGAPLDVSCRCARTVASGALGREALDAGHGDERRQDQTRRSVARPFTRSAAAPGPMPVAIGREALDCRHGGERRCRRSAGRAARRWLVRFTGAFDFGAPRPGTRLVAGDRRRPAKFKGRHQGAST